MLKKSLCAFIMLIIAGVVSAQKITLREDGITLIDGKPFFPIGSYRDPSQTLNDFSGLKEAGFNMTHEYYFEQRRASTDELIKTARTYLDDAHKNGLKVFMGIPRKAVKKEKFQDIERFAAALADKPALLTWYVYDEPLLHKLPFDKFKKAADAIRKGDPGHPLTMAMAWIRKKGTPQPYLDAVDIVSVDTYPIGSKHKDPIRALGQNIRIAYKKSQYKKPVWSIIQAFEWEYLRKEKTLKKDGAPTIPTMPQLRYMNYLSLASNAKGIIYYWQLKRHYDVKKDSPTVWKSICESVKELNGLQPFLVAYEDKTQYKMPRNIKIWTRQHKNKRVVALINYYEKPAVFSWRIPWENVKSIVTYPEYKIVKLDKSMQFKFAPIEVKVFILEF